MSSEHNIHSEHDNSHRAKEADSNRKALAGTIAVKDIDTMMPGSARGNVHLRTKAFGSRFRGHAV